MSLRRFAAKADRNQPEIVAALRAAGYDVMFIGKPVDLLAAKNGVNFLLEVKVPKAKGERGGKLTPEQEEFFATWRGQKAVVRTVEEALQVVGAVA